MHILPALDNGDECDGSRNIKPFPSPTGIPVLAGAGRQESWENSMFDEAAASADEATV